MGHIWEDCVGDEYSGTFFDNCDPDDKRAIIVQAILDTHEFTENLANELVGNTSGSTSSGSCNLFCDSTGYEPSWAKSMGENQAQFKCIDVVSNEYGTRDSNWCTELAGYMLDKLQ